MKKMLSAVLVSSVPLLSLAAQTPLPQGASPTVDYDKDVKPLLAQNCYSCHGPEVQQSGLRLDLRQNALRGGDYGPVIVAGKSSESKLIHRLVNGDGGMQMPPTGALLPEEISILRAWIDQGADFRNDVAEEAPPKPIDPRLATLIAAVRSGSRSKAEPLIAGNRDLVERRRPVRLDAAAPRCWLRETGHRHAVARCRCGREREESPRVDAALLGHRRRSEGPAAAVARRGRQPETGRRPHAAVPGGLAGQRTRSDAAAARRRRRSQHPHCQRPHPADGRRGPRRHRGHAPAGRRQGASGCAERGGRDRTGAGGQRWKPGGHPVPDRARRRPARAHEARRDRAWQRRHSGKRGDHPAAAGAWGRSERAKRPRLLAVDARRELRHGACRGCEGAAGQGRGHQPSRPTTTSPRATWRASAGTRR